MKHAYFSIVLAVCGLSMTVEATEEHLLSVFQPLVTLPEIEIGLVSYVTWYGALEESTIAAVAWPAMLDSPHKERTRRDLNMASVLGFKLLLEQGEKEGWRVTVDLTKLKPLPDEYRQELLAEDVGRKEVFQRVLEATSKNLRTVGVFDCELNVLGEEAHEDFKGVTFPKVLNAIGEVWGPWEFEHLPKVFADGNLQQLAAQSLADARALDTLFLIASGEAWAEESRREMSTLLLQLMGRVGDDVFAKHLGKAESEVRKLVIALMVPTEIKRAVSEPDLKSIFPRTFSLGID